MTTSKWTTAAFLLLCLEFAGESRQPRATGQEGQPPTEESIFKALADREAATDWIRAKCDSKISVPKGLFASERNPKVLLPLEDLSFDHVVRFSIGPDKWRYEHTGYSYDPGRQELIKDALIVAYNNGVRKNLIPKADNTEYPQGNISDGGFTNIPQSIWMKAFFLLFRPLKSGLVGPGQYKLITTNARIGDIPCVVLEQSGQRTTKRSIWLERTPPHSVLRYATSNGGKVLVNCEFHYESGATFPKKWVAAAHSAEGRLQEDVTTIMTELAIEKSLPAEDFELDFPVGTVVFDRRKTAPSGATGSIIVGPGAEKPFKGDPKRAYQEWATNASGADLTVTVVVAAVVVAVAASVVLWFRKKRMAASDLKRNV